MAIWILKGNRYIVDRDGIKVAFYTLFKDTQVVQALIQYSEAEMLLVREMNGDDFYTEVHGDGRGGFIEPTYPNSLIKLRARLERADAWINGKPCPSAYVHEMTPSEQTVRAIVMDW